MTDKAARYDIFVPAWSGCMCCIARRRDPFMVLMWSENWDCAATALAQAPCIRCCTRWSSVSSWLQLISTPAGPDGVSIAQLQWAGGHFPQLDV